MLAEHDEAEAARKAVSGDEGALAALLEEHGPHLRRRLEQSIQAKWRSALDADDVMQITYLEAFLRIEGFAYRGPGSFAAWLMRIAENNLRDAIRELERQKRPQPENRVGHLGREDSTIALLEELGCTTTTPSRDAVRHDLKSALDVLVRRLPDDYAAVVRMYDLEGRAAPEVAAALGRSEGAVYMLRARAHDRLREAIGSPSKFLTGSA